MLDRMTIEHQVFRLILNGTGPIDVMDELGISRYRYDSALSKLASMGAVGRLWQLPDGADAEMFPSNIMSTLLADVLESASWAGRITDSVRAHGTRYGIFKPKIGDPRYTFDSWEGQAFRRVDFTASDGAEYMVVGALMPRMDKKRWKEGTPYNRAVYIESEDRDILVSFVWPRGLCLSSYRVSDALNYPLDSELLIHSLTLAIAWVCETRALFPERLTDK